MGLVREPGRMWKSRVQSESLATRVHMLDSWSVSCCLKGNLQLKFLPFLVTYATRLNLSWRISRPLQDRLILLFFVIFFSWYCIYYCVVCEVCNQNVLVPVIVVVAVVLITVFLIGLAHFTNFSVFHFFSNSREYQHLWNIIGIFECSSILFMYWWTQITLKSIHYAARAFTFGRSCKFKYLLHLQKHVETCFKLWMSA